MHIDRERNTPRMRRWEGFLFCLQTMLLLSQTFNFTAHHKRDNILSTLIDSSVKVKDILKSQSKELDSFTNPVYLGKR